MPDLREQCAELLRDIYSTLATCLCGPADAFDGDWVDDVAAEMAEEWGMWLSAGVTMADWTYPIEAES